MRIKSFLVVLVLAVFFAGTAMADGFTPYASIRMFAGYHNQSKERHDTVDSDMDFMLQNNLNTRFGGKGSVGNVTVHVELGIADALQTSSNAVTTRLAYGKVKAGAVEIKIGQDYTPYWWPSNEATFDAVVGFGNPYDGRQPQLMLSAAGLYVSFMNVSRSSLPTGVTNATKTDASIPKFAVGYEFKNDMISIGPGFVYQSYKIEDVTLAGTLDGKSVTSWMGYLHGQVNVAPLMIRFNVAYGKNTGNMGVSAGSNFQYSDGKSTLAAMDSKVQVESGSLKDTTQLMYYVDLGFKTGAMTIWAGYGYDSVERDTTATYEDDQSKFYVNLMYKLDEKFMVGPTFSYIDYGKLKSGTTETKQGTEYWAGLKFQADI